MEREPPRLLEIPGLASELLRVAVDDAAPSDVRRGVLAVLGLDVTGSPLDERPGQLSTLSGVFEKEPAVSESFAVPSVSVGPHWGAALGATHPVARPRFGVTTRPAFPAGPPPSTERPSRPSPSHPQPSHPQPSHLQPMDLPPRHLQLTSLLYVAVAAAAGALIAKAAHLALPAGASGAVGSGAALTCECARASQAMMASGVPSADGSIAAEPSGTGRPRMNARRGAPGTTALGGRAPAALGRHDGGGRSLLRGRGEPAALPPVTATAAGFDSDVDEAHEDWLGEQLAILTRAERSLHEDDPDATLRSFEEYRRRFPQGLLDLQMAAVRQRAEERFEPLILP